VKELGGSDHGELWLLMQAFASHFLQRELAAINLSFWGHHQAGPEVAA
jgi:hypothetical protein